MAEARTFTTSHETMRKACEAALADPGGIRVQFTVDRHGTLEACYARARSFQQVFTTFRARSRKMAPPGHDPLNDLTQPRGPYDGLACQRDPLPDGQGWSVSILPGRLLLDTLDIISNSTGQPITSMGLGKDERETLLDKLEDHSLRFTIDDGHRLFAIDPELAQMYDNDLARFLSTFKGRNVEQMESEPTKVVPKRGIVKDLADLDMDVDPFTGKEAENDDA